MSSDFHQFLAHAADEVETRIGSNAPSALMRTIERERVVRLVSPEERAEILRLYANGTGVSIADLARKFSRQHSHITHIVANKPQKPKLRPALEAEILAGRELGDIAKRHGVGIAYMRSIHREMVSRGKIRKERAA